MRQFLKDIIDGKELVTTKEAAAYLGRDDSAIRHRVKDRRIESRILGKTRVYDIEDIRILEGEGAW